MNEVRAEIKKHILLNSRMTHFALNPEWYSQKNINFVLENIYKETEFLTNVSLRERIFYIQNDLFFPVKCSHCFNKTKFANLKFLKTCGDKDCNKIQKSFSSKKMFTEMSLEKKILRKEKISKANKNKKRTDEVRRNQSLRLKGIPQSASIISKRIASRKLNKSWFTEETKRKLSIANMLTSNSEEFKLRRKEIYKNMPEKLSGILKQKILNGTFTPCITNSWTRWDIFANKNGFSKKFRSSWEAFFWLLGEDLEYEKVRIPYVFDGKEKIYIVDFVSHSKKELYEIKPNKQVVGDLNMAKFDAAKKWCLEKGYSFLIIDDSWFLSHVPSADFSNNEHLKPFLKQFTKKMET